MTDETLFAAALALPAAERAAYLKAHCPDPAVRKQVEDLLAAADASNPLDQRLPDLDRTNPRPETVGEPTAAVGDRVGPYKLLEKIGEGGMGEVWVADQLEPIKRRVALKLIKPGMDSRSVLGRFEAERQALAVMDHPNIAMVLDAGTTTDGRPYFVMELVKGTPITEFADARKLTTQQRLELFVPVCQAIQHAHMKGIIHRDIKPSNVLVALHDETPVPKVIDFGVAKAVGQQLTEKTIYTGFGALVGTPAYMAPEQATFNQLDVDTRADVYALGVLLYELLAGSPPIEKERLKKAALDEVLRIVREEEPPRPSQRLSTADTRASIAATRGSEPAKLSQLMKGELDWIVMKALEKDRTRRYESANGFAADVQRYLSGEQVQAVPPSIGYRLAKAYRKNKAAVRVVTFFVFMALGAAVMGAVLAVRASDAERVAKENAEQANQNASAAQQAQVQALADRNAAIAARNDAEAAREQQAAEQYLADMQLMPTVFEKGNSTDAIALLARHFPRPGSPDRRRWEWHYWNRQLNTEDRSLQLEGANFSATDLWTASADGTKVACLAPPDRRVPNSSPAPTLTVWELLSGRKVISHTLPESPEKTPAPGVAAGPKSGPQLLPPVFAPDGTRIACGYKQSAGGDGSLVVLDVATGTRVLESRYMAPFSTSLNGSVASFSRDSTRLFLSDKRFPGDDPNPSRFYDLNDPTGRVVKFRRTVSASAAEVWGATPPEVTVGEQGPILPDGKSVVINPAFPLGRRAPVDALAGVAATAAMTSVIELQDLDTGVVKQWWPVVNGRPMSMALSDDGQRLAAWVVPVSNLSGPIGNQPVARPPRVKIWETETGKELGEWVVPESKRQLLLGKLTFSPGGSRLVAEMSSDHTFGRPITRKSRQVIALSGATAAFCSELADVPPAGTSTFTLSRDGNHVTLAWDDTLYAWSTTSGKLLKSVRTPGSAVRVADVTDDGRLWAVDAAGKVREWSLRSLTLPALKYQPAGVGGFYPDKLPMNMDGTRIGLLKEVEGTDRVPSITRSLCLDVVDPTGQVVRTLTPPKASAAWQAQTSDTASTAFSRQAERACLLHIPKSPSRRGTELIVWEVATAEVKLHLTLDGAEAFPNKNSSRVISRVAAEQVRLAFAPNGKAVAVTNWRKAKGAPNVVQQYDVDTARELATIDLPDGARVLGLTYSPSADRIAAVLATPDTLEGQAKFKVTLSVWASVSGEQLAQDVILNAETLPQTVFGEQAALAWSEKTDLLAVTVTGRSDGLFTVRDARTGKAVSNPELPSGRFGQGIPLPSSMSFHPDGSRLAVVVRDPGRISEQTIRLLDPLSGKALMTLFIPTVGPNDSSLTIRRQVSFSTDGRRLLLTDQMMSASSVSGPAFISVYAFDASPSPEPKK